MASTASSDPQPASPIREERRRRIHRSRGRPGSKGTALAQIEDGRTMGSTDPELPLPGGRRRANHNFARTILDRLGPQGSDRKTRARTEAKPTPATKSRRLTPPQAPQERQRARRSPFRFPLPIRTQGVDLTRSPSHREWPLFADTVL